MYATQLSPYEFHTIDLQSRNILHPRMQAWAFDNSECNFTNLFLWQANCRTAYSMVDDTLLIRFQCHREKEFLLPPLPASPHANYAAALSLVLDYFNESGSSFLMRSISPRSKEMIENAMPGRFIFTHERDSDDYVYLAEDLISLRGKKLHAKRNHINKFKTLYDYQYESYSVKAHLEECLRLNALWHQTKDENQRMMDQDKDAVARALVYAEELGLLGGVIRVDGEIQAFSLGEKLTKDTALIHMEKANTELPGIYPVINQEFASHAWADTIYINREEDMGLEGLRKAKLSYFPHHMVEKYRATLA